MLIGIPAAGDIIWLRSWPGMGNEQDAHCAVLVFTAVDTNKLTGCVTAYPPPPPCERGRPKSRSPLSQGQTLRSSTRPELLRSRQTNKMPRRAGPRRGNENGQICAEMFLLRAEAC